MDIKNIFKSLLAGLFSLGLIVPAYAGIPNPDTGDHSMISVAVTVIVVAFVILLAVMFFTRKKK